MGAWIEMEHLLCMVVIRVASHPTWVRGLKCNRIECVARFNNVAPYMGAWIEIVSNGIIRHVPIVAPYMGAWIEIRYNCKNFG